MTLVTSAAEFRHQARATEIVEFARHEIERLDAERTIRFVIDPDIDVRIGARSSSRTGAAEHDRRDSLDRAYPFDDSFEERVKRDAAVAHDGRA